MNLYVQMWDELGYGRRWQKIMTTSASRERKLVACSRTWHRMLARRAL